MLGIFFHFCYRYALIHIEYLVRIENASGKRQVSDLKS